MDITRHGSKPCAANFCFVESVLMIGCASQQDGVHDDVSAAADAHHDRDRRIRPNRGPGSDLPKPLRRDFFKAAAGGDVRSAKRLLAQAPLLIDAWPDNESRTPLIAATWGDHVEMVQLLIAGGADLEAEDYVWGGSALGWSGWFGRPAVASVLIASGAEVNHPNRGGCTPLGSAAAAAASRSDQGHGQATAADRSAVIALLIGQRYELSVSSRPRHRLA